MFRYSTCAFSSCWYRVAVVLLVFGALARCELRERKRPYGYVRLGSIANFLAPETYVRDHNLLIRRDERGLYAMSTMCTRDSSELVPKRLDNGQVVFVSPYTSVWYDQAGKVISGKAPANLPYYRLKLDQAVFDGPRDTLYVVIGDEVPPDWRLAVQ